MVCTTSCIIAGAFIFSSIFMTFRVNKKTLSNPLFQLLNRLPITNKLNFGENKKVNKRILDYTIKNFYMNDVISRASITMANCTREILNKVA